MLLGINDINLLNSQNEGLRKQNKNLQTKFFEILKICNEPADSMDVLDLQKRIKKVLNEQTQQTTSNRTV